ncbi:MAG: hypothetical protein QOH93_2856, partial [Chloroflexia bacterium]|nr:hypothetical protein [Chloroflexia bacterium]
MRRGRIAGVGVIFALSVMLGVSPGIKVTFALLTAGAGNPNTVFAATSLYTPASLQAIPSGHNGALTWPAGQNGNGYKVLGVGNGTSSTCPVATSASYTSIGTTTTTLAYTDTNRSPTSVPQGTWYCYQVQTTYQSWSSVQNNPVAGAQVGVVATSVQLIDASGTTRFETGDQLVFTFNQAITPSTGPVTGNSVCSTTSTIWLGSTATSGGCAATETVNLGKITGGTLSDNARWSATYVWSNGNKTLTVTLGSRTAGNRAPTMTASTWTFTPTTTSTKLLSTTGSFHICDSNTGGGNCLPTMSQGTGAAAAAQQGARQSAPADADAGAGTAIATTTATRTATAMSTATSV